MRLVFPCLLFGLEEPHKPLEIGGLPGSLGSFWSVTFEPFQMLISYSSSDPELEVHWPPGKQGRGGVCWDTQYFKSVIKQTRVPPLPQTQCFLQGCCCFVFIRLYLLSVLCSHSVAIFLTAFIYRRVPLERQLTMRNQVGSPHSCFRGSLLRPFLRGEREIQKQNVSPSPRCSGV